VASFLEALNTVLYDVKDYKLLLPKEYFPIFLNLSSSNLIWKIKEENNSEQRSLDEEPIVHLSTLDEKRLL
jgi:hypothetical protein